MAILQGQGALFSHHSTLPDVCRAPFSHAFVRRQLSWSLSCSLSLVPPAILPDFCEVSAVPKQFVLTLSSIPGHPFDFLPV